MANCQILIVEDDEEIRLALTDVLEDHGFQAVTAVNGKAALDLLARSLRHPDLILLDLMMPVMDGATFRENQLKNPTLAEIPVVVISAFHDVVRLAQSMRPKHTLPKPLDLHALLKIVREVCPQHPAC